MIIVITLLYLQKVETTKTANSYIEIMYEFVIAFIKISSLIEITMMYFKNHYWFKFSFMTRVSLSHVGRFMKC